MKTISIKLSFLLKFCFITSIENFNKFVPKPIRIFLYFSIRFSTFFIVWSYAYPIHEWFGTWSGKQQLSFFHTWCHAVNFTRPLCKAAAKALFKATKALFKAKKPFARLLPLIFTVWTCKLNSAPWLLKCGAIEASMSQGRHMAHHCFTRVARIKFWIEPPGLELQVLAEVHFRNGIPH